MSNSIKIYQNSKAVYINRSVSGGGGGTAGRGITDAEIVGNDLVLTFDQAPLTENVGRVVGFNGTNGTNGTNGATWFQGSGAPSVGLGVNGDFYLNTTTQDVSQKQSGTWVVIANIKGAQGIQGEQGIQGATGATGPSSLQPFIDAPEELEHFTGYRGGADFSLVFGAQTANSTIVQLTTENTAFESISVIRNTLTPTTGNSLTQFRKSSVFLPTYNPVKNDFIFELGFAIPQLPTAAQNFQIEVSAGSSANNVGFASYVDGVAARLEFNASTGRPSFVLETRAANVSSTAVATITVAINTEYKMRVRLNQPSGVAELIVNGTVVATLATNLPTALLMKRILFIKTAGTGTVIADYDYHYDKITYL
jgi:hypothetical protein